MIQIALVATSGASARALGQASYFTGLECKRGHVAKRDAGTGTCSACTNARTSRWYRGNKERRLAVSKKWRLENWDKELAAARLWRKGHKDQLSARNRAWRANNPVRSYDAQKRWRAANREQWQVYQRTRHHVRRARFKNAEGRFTAADVEAILARQEGRCVYCRHDLAAGFHIDHVVALAHGGSNWPSNLQLTCSTCNLQKGVKSDEAFRALLLTKAGGVPCQ